MKRILIVTDTWYPKIDGIVRTTHQLQTMLERRGHAVRVVHPGEFATVPLPVYPELRLSLLPRRGLARAVEEFAPDHIHLMTEGPLGLAARALCARRGMPFTTSYHTHLHLYVHVRYRKFLGFVYGLLNWFHKKAERTMVATESLKSALETHNFRNLVLCPLGVDTALFVRNPGARAEGVEAPVFLYVGRIAPEKSVEDFLRLELPGAKLVVGDGPQRAELERRYPAARFVGYRHGQELVDLFSIADVLVFPSRTETFGLVALEALACGVPVAAYDVMGPRDIVTTGVDGYLGDDLRASALACLNLDRAQCRQKALHYTWDASADAFLSHLVPLR